MAKFNCPSCGAQNTFNVPNSVYTVCPYCKASIFRQGDQLINLGKVAELAEDNSPIQLRSMGVYQGKTFSVVGRVRMQWADGFWNEWCLYFNDGKYGWLGEAQGEFLMMLDFTDREPVKFSDCKLNDKYTLQKKEYIVADLKKSKVYMSEGELPFRAHVGDEKFSADLRPSFGTHFGSLEYDDGAELARVYLGEAMTLKQLSMTNLRKFDGW